MEGKYNKLKVDKTKAVYREELCRESEREEKDSGSYRWISIIYPTNLSEVFLDSIVFHPIVIEMDAEIKIKSGKIMNMTLHVAHRLPKPWAPFKEGWTDNELQRLRRGLHFSVSAYSRDELKKILTRFYYLYFEGRNEVGDNVYATLNDVIAIAQTDHGPIWGAPPPNAKAFYTPNVSQTDNLRMVQVGASDNENLLSFCAYVGGIIQAIDPVGPSTENETCLVRLTSFLGLTMYRFATKISIEMANTFMGTQYKNDLISLAGWPANAPFSPPCNSCLKFCEVALAKGLFKTSKVFTIVVNEYVITNSVDYVNTSAKKMLAFALLNDTAMIGLELVQMMEHVTVILGIEWRDLLGKTYFKTTRSSWDRITKFFISQNNVKRPQYSFYWAKMIDDGYFRELALDENLFLATIFGTIIEKVEGQGVWQAEWAQKTVLSKDAKSIGRALYP